MQCVRLHRLTCDRGELRKKKHHTFSTIVQVHTHTPFSLSPLTFSTGIYLSGSVSIPKNKLAPRLLAPHVKAFTLVGQLRLLPRSVSAIASSFVSSRFRNPINKPLNLPPTHVFVFSPRGSTLLSNGQRTFTLSPFSVLISIPFSMPIIQIKVLALGGIRSKREGCSMSRCVTVALE